MPFITETNRLNDILKWEQENFFSREGVTVAAGQDLAVGAVIGRITKDCPAEGAADAGNTGNGTCTGVSAGDDAQVGTYTLTCIAAAADAGSFAVRAPNGEALPDAAVGTPYVNEQIQFTLNDGATDFAVSDVFTIAIAAGSGKVTAVNFAATDGSQVACGLVVADYDASAADLAGVAVVRDAVVAADNLVWPDGATADQKAAALAELKAAGIVTREEA